MVVVRYDLPSRTLDEHTAGGPASDDVTLLALEIGRGHGANS